MKRTALYQKHLEYGAKMIPFAGYEMPVQYNGVTEEHLLVRQALGIFDVSHMGEFIVSGPGALPLLQYTTSNDVSKLSPGAVQYSCMPNGRGGIVDDLLVYCLAADTYMLVVNASNIEKDFSWLKQHNTFGAELADRSDAYALFAVQGPKAAEALQSLTNMDLHAMKYYSSRRGTVAGIADVLVSATGYTGAGGFELYVDVTQAVALWDAIMRAGNTFGIQPVGLAARDTLRLEMGFCLYGNDIDEHTSPLEAGLSWITKFSKDFIDRPRLEAQKQVGLERRLVGFVMEERGIPRNGYRILSREGEEIGRVTSGTQSPSLAVPIGLGYVAVSHAAEGAELYIEIRGKALRARVKKPPFVKPL